MVWLVNIPEMSSLPAILDVSTWLLMLACHGHKSWLKRGKKFPSSFPVPFLKLSCGSDAVADPKAWVKEMVREIPAGRAGMG